MTTPAPRLETLYWPCLPCGIAGGARRSPHDWFVEIMRTGPHPPAVTFMVEDVLTRFQLVVHADGSFRTTPDRLPEFDGAAFITDQGDTGDTLDDLIAACVDTNPEWMYPLEYECRVAMIRPRERYRIELMGLERVGNRRGGKLEYCVDG